MTFFARVLLPLSLILPFHTAHADQVKYLHQPKTALAAFVSTMAEAKSSIDVATFIFEGCEPSVQIMLDILAQKARSGVRVRVLLDALLQKSPWKDSVVSFLTQAGAQVRYYNVIEPNMRMHIKMLVVDGRTYIAGGRNLSDRYFGLHAEKNFVDRDVLVTGASATQATAAYDELWTSKNTRAPSRKAAFTNWKSVCGDVAARTEEVRDLLDRQGQGLLADVPERSCANVRFVADHPDFGNGEYGNDDVSEMDSYMNPMRMERKQTTKSMLAYFGNAKSSLHMENWIYVPLNLLDSTLANLRKRKIDVQVITNQDTEDGPQVVREAMDYAVKVHAERDSKGTGRVRLISSQGGLSAAYELTPKTASFFLHGKVSVRDGRDVSVGSFNLDSRSYSTNLESAVIVRDCPDLAADVQSRIDELNKIYEDDIAANRIPRKKEASFAAKMLAIFSLGLL